MCTLEKDGFTWHEGLSPYDRRIWKLQIRDYPCTAAVIFDYSPAVPPFKLCMLVADVPVSWHDDLQKAKQTTIGHVVAWKLHVNH